MKTFHGRGCGFNSQCPRKTTTKKIAKSMVGNSTLRRPPLLEPAPTAVPAGERRPQLEQVEGEVRTTQLPDRWGRALMLTKVPAAAPVPNSVERGLRTGPAVPPEAYPSWTVNAYDLDLEGMRRLFDEWSLPAYRAQQVFAGLWARADTYEEMTDLPGALRRRLDAELPAQLEVLTERSTDRGATRKALL